MASLKWNDAEEIAVRLFEKRPHQDPLAIRFTDLLKWVCQLEDFADDPKASNEAKLEAIQMAWLEQYREANG